ncbi:MAG: adenosylcobalamin-dependent ribonucleoside-diphosphate reductase [Bacteroidetes bacterium]|nr:adenosylcobalamin-dependent ribonucleoside-diphosphate reductase [Bacteroidota bacterium]
METNNDLFINIDKETEQEKENFYEEVLEARSKPEVKPDGKEIAVKEAVKADPVLEGKKQAGSLKTYSSEKVLLKSTEYFKGDTLAANVWMNKYALKDSDGNIYEQTPDDMHWRIANEIARIEQKYPNPLSAEEVYELIREFKYIVPQGSPMSGIGNNLQVSSLSNCFVIGNEGNSDSYGGIMKIDQEQVQLMKRRGGVGHDLSHIRPTGSPVKNSALTSTGIVPFMERYSNSTREVAQDGRRGALMLSISSKHPDAESFIDAKLESGKVTGANISVKIDDEFMRAVIEKKPYVQQYPVDSPNPKIVKEIDAGQLWGKIIHNAWSSAEPGVLFWDTISREAIPDCYADLGFKTVSTNPCGEIPLCPYDSCRLLAMNLYSYVDEPFTSNAIFNSDLFTKHARLALRIMDDIIDLEAEKIDAIITKIDNDPEAYDIKMVERNMWENIRKKTLEGRRTGIGITAEGDMLAALGCRYGSESGIDFSTEVHKLLAIEVYRSSVDLARERGPFPIFDLEREKNNPFINRIKESAPRVYENMQKYGRRNIATLTIAPTGSVSICTQTSSGIEPVFSVNYKRRRKVNPNDKNVTVSFTDELGDTWEEYTVFHPKFEIWLEKNGYDKEKVKTYPDKEFQKIIKKSPYYEATSADIDWLSKVRMQGAVQKWVDHSISVTVNIPEDASEELVSKIYQTAWESGCKGMTIYREGSRAGVLIRKSKMDQKDSSQFPETTAPSRPQKLDADVVRFMNDNEEWVAVVGVLNNKPYEIFTGKAEGFFVPEWVKKGQVVKNKKHDKNKPGTRYDFHFEDKDGYKVIMEGLSRQFNKEFWNYAKLISGILRHGMPMHFVVDLVDNLILDSRSINTWKNGVVRALKKYIPDGTKAKDAVCPECENVGTLMYKEGCLICSNCGYSQCG